MIMHKKCITKNHTKPKKLSVPTFPLSVWCALLCVCMCVCVCVILSEGCNENWMKQWNLKRPNAKANQEFIYQIIIFMLYKKHLFNRIACTLLGLVH